MGKIKLAVRGVPAIDGAGVQLTRVLGRETVVDFDPFLMMDSFDSTNPEDYISGFPRHPHRGIETLTYLIEGEIDHQDTMGNRGKITDGSAQWMTAGSGIEHSEMPQAQERLLGLQLWINLPKEEKMTKPKYFDIHAEDIGSKEVDGAIVRVLSGELESIKGVKPNHLQVSFYDISIDDGKSYTIPKNIKENAFIFNILGDVKIGGEVFEEKTAMLTDDSEEIEVFAHQGPARIIFVQGPMLKEPIAWAGPIVMNTQEELVQASRDYQSGNFIRDKDVVWID